MAYYRLAWAACMPYGCTCLHMEGEEKKKKNLTGYIHIASSNGSRQRASGRRAVRTGEYNNNRSMTALQVRRFDRSQAECAVGWYEDLDRRIVSNRSSFEPLPNGGIGKDRLNRRFLISAHGLPYSLLGKSPKASIEKDATRIPRLPIYTMRRFFGNKSIERIELIDQNRNESNDDADNEKVVNTQSDQSWHARNSLSEILTLNLSDDNRELWVARRLPSTRSADRKSPPECFPVIVPYANRTQRGILQAID
ncbi:hypothetical protein M0804_003900 [Polistes exclamans]|nr:hypothetical protein M0804_003900 [Polistes exclamans]